jgi:hypothetical protein
MKKHIIQKVKVPENFAELQKMRDEGYNKICRRAQEGYCKKYTKKMEELLEPFRTLHETKEGYSCCIDNDCEVISRLNKIARGESVD